MSDSLRPNGLCSPWNSPGQNTGVGSRSLLQGIFPTQESNPGLQIEADSLPAEPPEKPWRPKNSRQISRNSRLLGCGYFLSRQF